MRSKAKFSIFALANFFIRSMKFHERMTLLAVILFIPLFTFSYLFISNNKIEINKIEAKVISSKLNLQLLDFIKELQYYRGRSYTFSKTTQIDERLVQTEKNLEFTAEKISKNYHKLKDPSLHKRWIYLYKNIKLLLSQKETKNTFNYFMKSSEMITSLHHLMEQNQVKFPSLVQHSLQMNTLDKVLFHEIPPLLENLAILRGVMSNILFKNSITALELEHIEQNYYAMHLRNDTMKSRISFNQLNNIILHLDPKYSALFATVRREILNNTFDYKHKKFFSTATQGILKLHLLIDKAYDIYTDSLNTLLKNKKSTYNNFLILLFAALSLALYIYIAIYILMRRHLKNLQLGSLRLSHLNYNHKIIIDSDDEFSEIADSINELAYTLKFDVELIDKYIPISKTNIHGVITEVNDAFCHLTGYSEKELIGKTHSILRHESNTDEYFKHLWQTILKGETWDAELLNKNKKGEDIWVSLHIIPLKDKSDKVIGFTGLRRDITEKKKAQKLAITDSLTNIFNRQYFNQLLDMDIKKAKRYDYTFSLIMIDLDNFKNVNDTYGHLEGDEILKRFSQLVASLLRTTDTFARWGGEEFMILLPYTDVEQASKLAESLRKTIENYCKSAQKNTTISLGVTSFKALEDDKEELISRCDTYLYKAKELGRNRVVSD